MVDFLPAFKPCVGHDAKAAFRVRIAALLQCQIWRERHHAPQERRVLRGNLRHRRDMRLGNHEEVDRRPGVDIVESEDFLILIDLAGGNLTGNDLAKKAVRIVHGERNG